MEEVESEGSWIEGRHVMAGLIGGGAAGVLFATLVIILCIHRIKKKDEGSYSIADQARFDLTCGFPFVDKRLVPTYCHGGVFPTSGSASEAHRCRTIKRFK